jgi:hypothetical protein
MQQIVERKSALIGHGDGSWKRKTWLPQLGLTGCKANGIYKFRYGRIGSYKLKGWAGLTDKEEWRIIHRPWKFFAIMQDEERANTWKQASSIYIRFGMEVQDKVSTDTGQPKAIPASLIHELYIHLQESRSI